MDFKFILICIEGDLQININKIKYSANNEI